MDGAGPLVPAMFSVAAGELWPFTVTVIVAGWPGSSGYGPLLAADRR